MEVEVTYRIAAHLRIVTEDNINMAIFMFIHAADNIVGCEVIIGIEKNTISDCANLMPKLRDTAALLFFFSCSITLLLVAAIWRIYFISSSSEQSSTKIT